MNKKELIKQKSSVGFVKVYRSLAQECWYKRSSYVHLFQHLMILATFKEEAYTAFFNGEDLRLKPGQIVTGRNKLSRQTGISPNTIHSILKYFEKRGSIKQVTTNTCRLITITNWNDYQQPDRVEL